MTWLVSDTRNYPENLLSPSSCSPLRSAFPRPPPPNPSTPPLSVPRETDICWRRTAFRGALEKKTRRGWLPWKQTLHADFYLHLPLRPLLHLWQPSVEVDENTFSVPHIHTRAQHTETHPLFSFINWEHFTTKKTSTHTCIHAQVQYAQKTLGCINTNTKKEDSKEERRGRSFVEKPKQPTRMLAGLYLFAF